MSLFADFKRDREGKTVIENDDGFIVYKFAKEACHVDELYLRSGANRGLDFEMLDFVSKIAKQNDCKRMFGYVHTATNGAQDVLLMFFTYGMRLHSAENDRINLVKDL